MRLVIMLVAAVLLAGCSSSSTKGSGSTAGGLPGTYTFVQDVGGIKLKPPATVTLTLKADGTLTIVAANPDDPSQDLSDKGTWKTSGDTITLTSEHDGINGTGTYTLAGNALTFSFHLFDTKPGNSEWTRAGTTPASSGPPSGSSAPPSSTPPATQGVTWDDSVYDTGSDAAAAGTKAYIDALNAGAGNADAVQQALATAKAVPGVASAALSKNNLNITVTYTDGKTEDIVTERLLPKDQVGANAVSDPATCDTLPAQVTTPQEPTREAINPAGGYGVQIYQPTSQPKAITSADTPPVKRALLLAPQYDVMHPIHKNQYTIRGITGNSIECVSASLQKRGYAVDTILGKVSGSTRSQVGERAVADLIKDLTTNKYGFVYFLGHGYLTQVGDDFAGIVAGEVDLNYPEVQAVLHGGKVTHDNFEQVEEAYAKILGLTWDPNDKPISLAPDDNGKAGMVIRPPLFTQLRARGLDLSKALVFINGCSSGASAIMAKAVGAKSYIGWKVEMSGEFVGDVAEQIVDVLTDSVKTVRFATQVWQLHEKWRLSSTKAEPAEFYGDLVALGENDQPYDVLDAQTYILIFAIRNGPSSPTADVAKNATFVQNCYTQVWKPRKGALASPACHALQYGADFPTEAQVVDALFEVGAKKISGGSGRWTLAD